METGPSESFETNPRADSYLDDEEILARARRSIDNQDDEEDTESSNGSQFSDVEPSFFIIPPKETSQPKKQLPWARQPNDGLVDGLSITSSGTLLEYGAYRRDRLVKEIDTVLERGNDGFAAILKTLKRSGVMIFIVDSKVSSTIPEIMDSIHNVILHSRKVKKQQSSSDQRSSIMSTGGSCCFAGDFEKGVCDAYLKNQCCLLYRDPEGRLFNLTLAPHTAAMAGKWEGLLQSFSVVQAVALLTVLVRSFSCATSDTSTETFGPAYLATILGLVFSEELSLSWTNVGMFVRGFPSISAFEIMSRVESDWLRKALILCLAITSATTGITRKICTLGGIALACCILLANLGSRSWKFMGWKPLFTGEGSFCTCPGIWGLQSILEGLVSYALAVVTGLFLPYMGHRQIESGGTAAMESVLRIAVVVAAVFFASDHNAVQDFLVIGSGECSQEIVNMSVGIWWCVSLIACLLVLHGRKSVEYWPDTKEPLLIEDHASPIGFKVPHLPDFPIDPVFAAKPTTFCMNVTMELLVGVLLALGVGGFLFFLGYSNLGDQILGSYTRVLLG
mmetsp:Transcript_25106/g.43959  ORF Transcript_25106/g.43959 Transcript_25106/m.43959 type:complete len:563 (-) Transcript_25106:78-1766(-)